MVRVLFVEQVFEEYSFSVTNPHVSYPQNGAAWMGYVCGRA